MTEYEELIKQHDLTYAQQAELADAYLESPAGFARLAKRTLRAKTPAAALVACVRKGEHQQDAPAPVQKPVASLEDAVEFARNLFVARTTKYPPSDEAGWTLDDAIAYGVDFAGRKYGGFGVDDIERALRIRIGHPWDSESDPALGTGCPAELRDRILTKLRGFGDMPDDKPEPALKVDANELAQRLLATIGA